MLLSEPSATVTEQQLVLYASDAITLPEPSRFFYMISSQSRPDSDTPPAAHEKRMRAFIEVQLGKDALKLAPEQQKAGLQQKFRRLMIMMGVNVAVVLFFSYSFYYDITRLGSTWFSFIIVFFLVNVLLLSYQWKQLKQALAWLEAHIKTGGS